MSRGIELYQTDSGNRPVAKFIADLKSGEQVKIARSFDLLEEYGPEIGMPYIKLLPGTGGLWELRVPFGGQLLRLLFFIEGNLLVMVHAFFKKTAKTPLKEMRQLTG
jgi:phage-related protein